MDKQTYTSLCEIINYLHADEEKHWMEASKPAHGHIFNDVKRAEVWLDSLANKIN